MVDIAISDRFDLERYESSTNIRQTWDGKLELTSANELHNADFKLLDKDGTPVNVELGAPSAPAGLAFYAQRLTPTPGARTRQTLPVWPMDRDYTHVGPLIDGPSPPDVAERAKILSPLASRMERVDDGIAGFEVGYVALVFGWIVADTAGPEKAHVHSSPYLTAPSPRFIVEITAAGLAPEVTMPMVAPRGVVGAYIASTAPQASANLANVADLFVQRRIDIRAGQYLTYALMNPFDRDERAPLENESLVGAFQRWPAPDRKLVPAEHGVMYSFTTTLTYRFKTGFGISLPQQETEPFKSRGIGEKKAYRYHPRNIAGSAIAWQPIFSNEGTYYGLPWREIGEPAEIRSNDPSKYKVKLETIDYSESGRDGTGTANPETEIETVTLINKPQLPVGDYRWWAAYYDEDLKLSAPSKAARWWDAATQTWRIKMTIASLGQTPKIYRPQYGNVIPNGALTERDRTNGADKDPSGWTITRTGNFSVNGGSVTVRPGAVDVVDNSNASTTEDFAVTPFTDILEDDPAERFHRLRVGVRVTDYTSGRVGFLVRYYDATKALVHTGVLWGTVGRTANGASKQYQINDTVYVTFLIAKGTAVLPPGVTRDESIPATAKYFRVVGRAIGATAGTGDGLRNMDYTATGHVGMRGLAAPRRMPSHLRPVPDLESDEDLYPEGGVCYVEENPRNSKRHADLASKNLNAVCYWAPHGTPASPEHGPVGFKTPVKPGTTKRFNVYAEYDGVSVETDALRLVCRDRRGRVVADYGHLVENAHGSAPPTRYGYTLEIPEDGAYVEISQGNLSDGFWRIMAPMQKAGTAVIAWTNEHAASGSRSWILDAGAPGCVEGSLNEAFSAVTEVVRGLSAELDEGSAPGDDPEYEGTAVTTTYQTSPSRDPYFWSSAVQAAINCPPGRYWLITLSMGTDDTTKSPHATQAGVRVLRPYGVLLRDDGTEFPNGGCILNSFPPLRADRKRSDFVSDSNVWRQFVSGEWMYRLDGVALKVQSREAAEAVYAHMSSGKPFVLESALRRKALTGFVPADATIEFSPVEGYLTFDPHAPDGRWEEMDAEGVSFVVVGEEDL